jgi:type IV fimbrial biogenesis protein FimT
MTARRPGGARTRPGRLRGFTTIELLVTVSISAVVLGMAVPAMTDTVRRSLLSSASAELVTAVNRARFEASRSNLPGTPYTVCASSGTADPATATCGSTWTAGAIVFADANGNGARDNGEPVVYVMPPMDSNLTVARKSSLTFVLYAPNGMLHGDEAGMRFTISHSRSGSENENQYVCVLRSGVQAVSKPVLDTDTRFTRCRTL